MPLRNRFSVVRRWGGGCGENTTSLFPPPSPPTPSSLSRTSICLEWGTPEAESTSLRGDKTIIKNFNSTFSQFGRHNARFRTLSIGERLSAFLIGPFRPMGWRRGEESGDERTTAKPRFLRSWKGNSEPRGCLIRIHGPVDPRNLNPSLSSKRAFGQLVTLILSTLRSNLRKQSKYSFSEENSCFERRFRILREEIKRENVVVYSPLERFKSRERESPPVYKSN